MNRWPRYLIFFTLCIIVLTFVFASTRRSEPTYRGQTLTYWLLKSLDGDRDATFAVRQIGTNAVPCLTKWLLYEPSKIKVRILAANEKLPRKICNPLRDFIVSDRHWELRPDLAAYGFVLLGPQAQSAAPELVRALSRHKKGDDYYRITTVLRNIADDSLPPLVSVMTNQTSAASN
jgi:hypothetical protein